MSLYSNKNIRKIAQLYNPLRISAPSPKIAKIMAYIQYVHNCLPWFQGIVKPVFIAATQNPPHPPPPPDKSCVERPIEKGPPV